MIDVKYAILFTRDKNGDLNRTNSVLYKDLVEEFRVLLGRPTAKLAELHWHFLNNTLDIPKCKNCGEVSNWDRPNHQYRPYCCTKCSSSSVEVRSKVLATNLKQFGGSSPINCPKVRNKIRTTNLVKYGVEHPLQNSDVMHKMEQTNIERYGYARVLKNPEIFDKFKNTMIDRYGSISSLGDPIVAEKRKRKCLLKYGYDHSAKHPDVMEKSKQTNLDRYGVPYTLQNDDIRQRGIVTCNERYGRDYKNQDHISDETYSFLNNKDWLETQHHTNKRTLESISNELHVGLRTVCRRFKEYDIEVKHFLTSTGELEVKNFILDKDVKVDKTRRLIPPYEIDLYAPELNIAIEYNGVIWHSENYGGKDRSYHIGKHDLCEKAGVRLVQIFSSEWKYKRDIVESRLLQILNKSTKIHARKCKIVEISRYVETKFLEANHLQGGCSSSIRYGLVHDDSLVAVMTFGKSRFNKKYEYELIRFCNVLNHSVVGGASKLFKHFVKEHSPQSIVSYSDKRWNTGKLYENLGFKWSHDSDPNYFYFFRSNSDKLFSRQIYQKHKLSKVLKEFDPQSTEWENMTCNGFDRIWDCGNSVWEFNISKVKGDSDI